MVVGPIFRDWVIFMQDMTYTKQLEQYEQRVMQKRLEEMPETERERLMEEVEKERDRRTSKR